MDQKFNDDIWIYSGGELYHAGVKGMQWGKHLPGTDWWKVGKNAYNQYMQKNTTTTQKPGYQYVDGKMVPYESQTKKASKVKAFGSAVKAVSTYAGNQFKNTKFGRGVRNFKEQAELKAIRTYNRAKKGVSKFWNQAKGFSAEKVKELSEFAKNAYSKVRGSVTNFLQKGTGLKDYIKQKASGSEFNAWLENAKQGVMIAANRYLEKIGMRKETESFITKKSNIPLSSLPKTSSLLPSERKLIEDSQNDINNIGKPGYRNRNASMMSVNDQVDEKLRKQGITIKR